MLKGKGYTAMIIDELDVNSELARNQAGPYKDHLYLHRGKKFDTYAVIFKIEKANAGAFSYFDTQICFKMRPKHARAETLFEVFDVSPYEESGGYLEMRVQDERGDVYKTFKFREGEYFGFIVGAQNGGMVMNEKFFRNNFEKVIING